MEESSIPYIVWESEKAREERRHKRSFIIILVLIFALLGSNAAWLYYESQFVDEVTTITQDNENGYNNYIGNDGDIYNGEADDYP